jgi:hypothetical protein
MHYVLYSIATFWSSLCGYINTFHNKILVNGDRMINLDDRSKFKMPDRILVLPNGWKEIEAPAILQRAYMYKGELAVIISEENHMHYSPKWYRHISLSRKNRVPSWDDVKEVKDLFAGPELKAIMVIPIKAQYININPYVLHIYCPLEFDPLPDFRCYKGNQIGL